MKLFKEWNKREEIIRVYIVNIKMGKDWATSGEIDNLEDAKRIRDAVVENVKKGKLFHWKVNDNETDYFINPINVTSIFIGCKDRFLTSI